MSKSPWLFGACCDEETGGYGYYGEPGYKPQYTQSTHKGVV